MTLLYTDSSSDEWTLIEEESSGGGKSADAPPGSNKQSINVFAELTRLLEQIQMNSAAQRAASTMQERVEKSPPKVDTIPVEKNEERSQTEDAQKEVVAEPKPKISEATSTTPMKKFDDEASANFGAGQSNRNPEWKPYRQYSRQDLNDAIQAVKNGQSLLEASRQFNVPSRTLHDKVKKGMHPGNFYFNFSKTT